MPVTPPLAFGTLLKQVRKRAGMTQRDLAAALGYSDSLISGLEKAQRLPDLDAVIDLFIPALGLQDDPATANRLVDCAAATRGERSPTDSWPLPVVARASTLSGVEPAHGLPTLPVELVGRHELVYQLGKRLRGHGGRLLTLLGPPGVGKTTLALAVAAHVQRHYGDGARFVPLAAVSDPTTMAATIIATVAPGDASNKPPQSRLIELLRRQSLLLVLDNLEQITDAAALIATLIAECPRLTILATSRERLHLRAEQRFKVPPLDLAAAVELFTQRAQAVAEDFRLSDHNRATVAAICTRLDCLPLALELCAAQVELFAPEQLLAQLQTRALDLLVDGAHDLPPQQRTLRHAIARSYALLGSEEQTLFRRLAVFVGGFDLAAVEAIGDEGLETGDWRLNDGAGLQSPVSDLQSPVSTLRSLIGKSLVRAETLAAGEQRFFLLETIREFALEQLVATGEWDQLHQRHYHIYLERFRTVDEHLRGPDGPIWFDRLQPEHDNLRAAVLWALDQACYEDAAWLVIAASWYCRLLGLWFELRSWHLALLAHRHQFVPELRLVLLIGLSSLARSPEELEAINHDAAELMALAERCSSKLLQSGVWHFIAKATPDTALSGRWWEKSITLAHEASGSPVLGREFGVAADHLFALASATDHYVSNLIARGEFMRAGLLIQEGLNACETRGYRSGIAAYLGNWGFLTLLQGELFQAYTLLDQAVSIAATGILPTVLAKTKTQFALVVLYRDDTTRARNLLMESLKVWLDIGDKVFLSVVYIYLAETALCAGAPAEAECWLARCLDYHVDPRRIGSAAVNCLLVAAQLAVVRQHYPRAATLFGSAEAARVRHHYTLIEPVRTQVDTALTAAQAALTPTNFAEAYAEGQQLTLEEAFVIALIASPTIISQPE